MDGSFLSSLLPEIFRSKADPPVPLPTKEDCWKAATASSKVLYALECLRASLEKHTPACTDALDYVDRMYERICSDCGGMDLSVFFCKCAEALRIQEDTFFYTRTKKGPT